MNSKTGSQDDHPTRKGGKEEEKKKAAAGNGEKAHSRTSNASKPERMNSCVGEERERFRLLSPFLSALVGKGITTVIHQPTNEAQNRATDSHPAAFC